MVKNRVDGSIKEVTGAAKETLGKIIGDAKLAKRRQDRKGRR